MREVIIHIGQHKTGTTSIQNSLHNINSNGFKTVRFKESNHSIPMFTLFSEQRYNYHLWKSQGYTESQVNKKRAEYEKILRHDIADESVNVFLISGEDISGLNENEQINLCNFFLSKNLKVRIICVVRDPFTYAISTNQQLAQGGAKNLLKINPNYQKRLAGFLKCDDVKISVFQYEDLISRGLIQSFSKIIGFPLKDTHRANVSVSSDALALIYALNKINTLTQGSKVKFAARQRLIRSIKSFFSESNGFKKLDLNKFDLVDEAVAEDLVWIKNNFGIHYQLPCMKKAQLIDFDYVPSSDSLRRFFLSYKLDFDTNISIVINMQNLYMRLLRIEESGLVVQQFKKLSSKFRKWLQVLKQFIHGAK